MNKIIETNETDFDTDVLKPAQPVIVDFWAEWCGPCKMLAPVLAEIAAEQTDVKIVKVNVDENSALAQRYAIQSIPTLLYFNNGAVRDQTVGMVGKKSILKKIENLKAHAEDASLSR